MTGGNKLQLEEAVSSAGNDGHIARNLCYAVAVLRLLVWLHVLPPLKQHLPPLRLPFRQLKHPTVENGLRWHRGHDHNLLLPSYFLHLPMRASLADRLPHRNLGHGCFHHCNPIDACFFDR